MVCLLLSYSLALASAYLLWLQLDRHPPAKIFVGFDVFSEQECSDAVAFAESANAWTRTRHALYPTDDFSVYDLPGLANLSRSVEERVLPLLRASFGIADGVALAVSDLFLIRYSSSSGGQAGLKWHTDETTLSISVALSSPESFSGGGVEFDLLPQPLRANRGSVVMHPSKLLHRGVDVTAGKRYVLVGFVTVGDDAVLTLGNSPPGSPELINGLWATCVQVVPSPGALGDVPATASNLPRALTEERCHSKFEVVARAVRTKLDTLGEGAASLWSGEEIGGDAQQLLILNGCLLLGSVLFLRVVS